MSRYGDFRSSTGDLGYGGGGGGGGGRGGGERWDTERFSREREQFARSGRAIVAERDRFEEHDRFERPRGGFGGRARERSADEFYGGGGGGGRGARFEERDRFIVDEKYGPPARRAPARYFEEDDISIEVSPQRGAMVPFDRSRRQSITAERGYGPPARRGPARPSYIRRQSSLDTFDRKPMPRYGDREREEIIPIPLPPRRRRSPPAPRYAEREFEEIRVVDPEPYPEEDFREIHERTTTRRRGPAGSEYEFREKDVYEEEEVSDQSFPRRGKTRMPKRLVNKRAVIELGYPFEEEAETIIILKALGKEHIDEVVKISREMNTVGENRTTYLIEAPAPAPPPAPIIVQPPEPQVIERRTEIITGPPPPPPPPPMMMPMEIPQSVRDWDVMSKHESRHESHHESHHGSHHGSHRRSPSVKSHKSRRNSSPPSRSEYEEEKGESNDIDARPLALFLPERRNPERIRAEIKALEAEKKALRYEREMDKEHKKAEQYREGDVIIEKGRDVIKIEKDRKAPPPALLKAMLATLT